MKITLKQVVFVMFIVSVYSFLNKDGNCIRSYEFNDVFDALEYYYDCLDKCDESKEPLGALMYTSSGSIIHGF